MVMIPLVAVTTILVFFKPTAIAGTNHNHNRVVTQVHLAQGVTSSSMTVSWVTPSSIKSSKSPTKKPTVVPHISDVKSDAVFFRLRQDSIGKKLSPYKKASVDGRELLEENHSNEVRYSTVASNMYLSAVGYNTSYTFNYKKEENYTSGYLHHTLLTNLLPSTVYYYQCGDFSTGSDNDLSGKATMILIFHSQSSLKSPIHKFDSKALNTVKHYLLIEFKLLQYETLESESSTYFSYAMLRKECP